MRENLYYLLVSGLLLGSGPCLGFCAPVLVSYTLAHKNSLKQSLVSYLVFSLAKLLSYGLLGLICALSAGILHNPLFSRSTGLIKLLMGIFIILIGIATMVKPPHAASKFCGWLHKGNIRNVGMLGLLIGLSPCLPLLGILNYIVIISPAPLAALGYSLACGIGTGLWYLALVRYVWKRHHKLTPQTLKKLFRVTAGILLLLAGYLFFTLL